VSVQRLDDRDGWIWHDGELRPWRDVHLHVLSHGLHYATTVFEGERAYGGQIFRLRDHTARLLRSAKLMGFEISYAQEQLEAATREVLKASGFPDAYVRPVAWRGSEKLGVSGTGCTVHVAIATWTWPNVFGASPKETGIRLQITPWRRPNESLVPTQAKSSALYAIASLSREAAERAGFDDALFLDLAGNVAESSGANLFCVIGNTLCTPTTTSALAGITRSTVIELAARLGWPVQERTVTLPELWRASEVFLTGTAYEVQPVRAIEDHTYSLGPVTESLVKAYDALVRGNLPEKYR
jgi:branched-chain amino acid aminotransferase